MKKLFIILFVLLLCVGCGSKSKKLSSDEIKLIHDKEKELSQYISDKTWHYEDEMNRAYYFNSDGTGEDYPSKEITWISNFTWEVKYGSYGDYYGEELETKDKEYIDKYYDYHILFHYVYDDGESETGISKLEYDGDLYIDYRKLVIGADFIKEMPNNLNILSDLLNRCLYEEEGGYYYLFYSDGTGFKCNGIFMDGEILNPIKFYWGINDYGFYMMTPKNYEGEMLQEVDEYGLDVIDGGFLLIDTWYETPLYLMENNNDTAQLLMKNYESLHTRIVQFNY